MITVLGRPRRFCDGLSRRELLAAGGVSLLGGFFGVPRLVAADDQRSPFAGTGKAKSVILLFLHGGAATQDMWDLKPNAPAEIRGEFQPIDTSASGIQVCEHLPLTARWMHKAAIVRTVNHKAACHNTLPAFTGEEIVVTDQARPNSAHAPSMGSVCEYLALRSSGTRDEQGRLPAYVCLPSYLGFGEFGRRPGIYSGFLGHRHDPFCAECSPHLDDGADRQNRAHPPELRGEPRIPHGVLQEGLTLDRLNSRKTLLEQIDDRLRQRDATAASGGYHKARQRAFDLLASQPLRDAFDLEREDPKLRDRYGRRLFGSSVLVARRLVEAGVRFVSVFWDNYAPRLQYMDYGWDTHMYNFQTLRGEYLPWLDRTYSALLEDLAARGLLDETLVVITSDFGRTPHINKDAGRDHWTYCYSTVLAGAGIRGGTAYGESDAHAAFVRDRPVSTGDVCATIYQCLGIDPETLVYDRTGRPRTIANGGTAIKDILA